MGYDIPGGNHGVTHTYGSFACVSNVAVVVPLGLIDILKSIG